MRKRTKKVLSVLLAGAMIITMPGTPGFALEGDNTPLQVKSVASDSNAERPDDGPAQEKGSPSDAVKPPLAEKGSFVITGFETLAENIRQQVVPAGTKLADLDLPGTLKVSGYRETEDTETAEETAAAVKKITWELKDDLNDGITEYAEDADNGAYVFTPVLPKKYMLGDGVELPEIHVLVGETMALLAGDVFDGEGTEKSPFLIKSAEDLRMLAAKVNNSKTTDDYAGKYYKIDDSVQSPIVLEDWTPIGNDTAIFSSFAFKGIFDGNGKEIDLTINDASDSYQGLFGYIDSAKIRNVSITGSIVCGKQSRNFAGGIAGKAINSTVENCRNRADVKGTSQVGGVVGSAEHTTVINCYNTGEISGSDSGSWVGGIVGELTRYAHVKYCYSTGSVSGGKSVGGVAGSMDYNNCSIDTCAALGSLITYASKNDDCGRIAGDKSASEIYYSWARSDQLIGKDGSYAAVTSNEADSLNGKDIKLNDTAQSTVFVANKWSSDIWELRGEAYFTVGEALPELMVFEALEGDAPTLPEAIAATNAAAPNLTSDLEEAVAEYPAGDPASPLSVTAELPDGVLGELSYQWFSSLENSTANGTKLDGETKNTYTPSTENTVSGTTYYYCVVTNTNENATGNKTASATSKIAAVKVNSNADMPVFSMDLKDQSKEYVAGDMDTLVTELDAAATVKDTGVLTYQWYQNTQESAENGTAIPDANKTKYKPSVKNAGITYYYCIVTNMNNSVEGHKTVSAVSTIARITVKEEINAAVPVITQDLTGQDAEYFLGETAKALSVTADAPDGGVLSYSWYCTENGNPGMISGAEGSSYTPDTTKAGTFIYQCLVKNTNENATGLTEEYIQTGTAQITVKRRPVTPPVITGDLDNQSASYTVGDTAEFLKIEAGAPESGTTRTWQWYSNSSDDNTTGSAIPGGIESSYRPPTDKAGTTYYYCTVTNENKDGSAESVTSKAACITVAEFKAVISGKITGSGSTGGLSGATVTLYDHDGTVITELATRPDGTWQLEGIPAGTYHIHVSCDHYESGDIPELVVKDKNLTGLDLELQREAAEARVTLVPYIDDVEWDQSLNASALILKSTDGSVTVTDLDHVPNGTWHVYLSNPSMEDYRLLSVPEITVNGEAVGPINVYFYYISLKAGDGISYVTGSGMVEKGTDCRISAAVSEGCTWKGWQYDDGTIAYTDRETVIKAIDHGVYLTAVAAKDQTEQNHTVKINLRMDDSPWSGNGEQTFRLSADEGKSFIENLTEVPDGTYTVFEHNTNTFTEVVVKGADTAATVNYYSAEFHDGEHYILGMLYPVLSGYTVPKPEPEKNPERTGYIFSGWVTEQGGGKLFDFSTPVTAKTVIYASWTAREERCSVTVNGSHADQSGAGVYKSGEVVTIQAGTCEGYTFSGWTSDGGTAFADAKSAVTTFIMPKVSVTVTANWARNSGGSSGGSSSGGSGSGSSGNSSTVVNPITTTPNTVDETLDGGTVISSTTRNTVTGTVAVNTINKDAAGVITSAAANLSNANPSVTVSEAGSRIGVVIDNATLLEALGVMQEAQTAGIPVSLTVDLPSEIIISQLNQEGAKPVNIDLTIPSVAADSTAVSLSDIHLSGEVIENARTSGKDLSIAVRDENGSITARWYFSKDALKGSSAVSRDQNLVIHTAPVRTLQGETEQIKSVTAAEAGIAGTDVPGLAVFFGNSGEFPAKAGISIPTGNEAGIKPGDTVWLYYYNQAAGRLESMADNQYAIGADGYVTFYLTHSSAYVLTPVKLGDVKPGAAGNTTVYTIKRGDTLYRLAKAYHCTVAEIMAVNQITDVYDLLIGQEIKIPVK